MFGSSDATEFSFSARRATIKRVRMLERFDRFERIWYIIIAFIGVPVNFVSIVIFSRGTCGLSKCTTRYLIVMAAADLLAVVTAVILRRISFYFSGTFLDLFEFSRVIFTAMCASRDCSVWFTVAFTFDRFVAICFQKLKTKYWTGKNADAVLATTGLLVCLKNVPFYFSCKPGVIINNVAWFCSRKSSYYTDPWWVGFRMMDKVITPLLPFALILLFNILTVRHILRVSRVRKALRNPRKGGNQRDAEMESRRKSVILLFAISGSFTLLWLTSVVDYLYYNFAGTNPGDYNEAEFVLGHVGYMLQNLSLCTNTFIYGVTQAKFRGEIVSAIKYPIAAIIRIFNKRPSV
ncbi:probable G-protein coupled receptor 139 [Narcine bancroftii]|uniref:probable G-protein coupled receptor 139 n=1 Tax=Narcine bancroftii TaxID=1343680 RepID=UPI0038321AAE